MTTQHTPGPWTLGYDGNDGAFEIGVYYRDHLATFVIASRNQVFHRAEESQANARLIAAAPDLLEACREFVRKCECGQAVSSASYQQMKAAIAKAEGLAEGARPLGAA